MNESVIENIVGAVPQFSHDNWLRTLADTMLPTDGYATARELSDSEDECKAATELLEILVDSGLAMSGLMEVGTHKEWVYGRLHEVS